MFTNNLINFEVINIISNIIENNITLINFTGIIVIVTPIILLAGKAEKLLKGL